MESHVTRVEYCHLALRDRKFSPHASRRINLKLLFELKKTVHDEKEEATESTTPPITLVITGNPDISIKFDLLGVIQNDR